MFKDRSTSCLHFYVLPVPSFEEIAFAIEILDTVLSPAMDKVEALIESAPRWDSIERNDFCRYEILRVFRTDANANCIKIPPCMQIYVERRTHTPRGGTKRGCKLGLIR